MSSKHCLSVPAEASNIAACARKAVSIVKSVIIAALLIIPGLSIGGCSGGYSTAAALAAGQNWLHSLVQPGQTGAELASASMADNSLRPSTDNPPATVYVSLVIHLEESFPQRADAFIEARRDLLDLAGFCRQHGLRFNLQPDWAFITAMQKFETADMRVETNDKNLILYLYEDLNMEIDPHSHEHQYNYADIAALIDRCGVKPSSIAGGLIAAPASLCQLERFFTPIQGQNFNYQWQAEYLWGGGTPNHIDEPVASGIWRPQSASGYYDDHGPLPAIGGYTGEITDIYGLVQKIASGAAPAGQCYTACIMFNQGRIREDLELLEGEIQRLEELQSTGCIKFVTLQELISTWREDYGARGFVYVEEPRGRDSATSQRLERKARQE